jgi:hypothetical protein
MEGSIEITRLRDILLFLCGMVLLAYTLARARRFTDMSTYEVEYGNYAAMRRGCLTPMLGILKIVFERPKPNHYCHAFISYKDDPDRWYAAWLAESLDTEGLKAFIFKARLDSSFHD